MCASGSSSSASSKRCKGGSPTWMCRAPAGIADEVGIMGEFRGFYQLQQHPVRKSKTRTRQKTCLQAGSDFTLVSASAISMVRLGSHT